MKKSMRRVVAWGLAMGLAAVFGIAGAASAEIAPNAYFLPSQGGVGQKLTLVGTGFPSDAEVLVSTNARDQPSPVGKTNRMGNFAVWFTVPDLPPGPQMSFITVEDVEWTVQFTVVASDPSSPPGEGDTGGALWFEPPAGTVGQELQLIGLGFPADTDVSVTTSASPDTTLVGKSGGNGSFTLPFTVPDLAPGQHRVDVTVGSASGSLQFLVLSGDPGSADFTVRFDPDPATAGRQTWVDATGLAPDAEVYLRVFGQPAPLTLVGNATDVGTLRAPWTVPDLPPGKYRVEVASVSGVGLFDLTVIAAEDTAPSPTPTASASPAPSVTETPTPAPTAVPQLAASGTPDVGALVPWGLAALAAAASATAYRLRSRAKE